jgi:plasmid segregation protein ParM
MSVIRAIDTGYGMTKFTLTDGPEPVCHCFPSIATRQKETVGEGILETLDTVTLNIDGSCYEVGPEVTLARGREHARILHGDYTSSAEYRALTLGALDYMGVDVIDLLVLGLPVNLTESRSRLLRKRFQGRQRLADNRTVDIRDVVVMAQPLGGLIHYLYQVCPDPALAHRRRLVIDPGSQTLDWLVTQGMKEIKGLSGSQEGSVSAVLLELARLLSREYQLDGYDDLFALDQGLRTGTFTLFGQAIELQPFLQEAQKAITPALTALRNAVGDGRDIDEILLVGGGASLFQAAIETAFPHHTVQCLEDALYANVRGFQQVGEVKARFPSTEHR